ncbi:MAG: hypothetical protein OEX81_02490 [Candidatus Pacebacteria bacterium]|nr:hypothetical protein [Candidatus Paceibacterota bacterium]
MKRSKEHQEFLDIHQDRKQDPYEADEVTTATPEEIEWWNKQKIWELRCLAQKGEADIAQLIILAGEGFFYRTTPDKYKPRSLRKK